MSYCINTFSDELENNYPAFLNIVNDTYLYYSYQESLLSIISGTREYNIAHYIMNVILDSFYSSYQNKTFISDNAVLSNTTLEYFLRINENLINILQKYYASSNFSDLQFYTRLNIEEKLNAHRNIIVKILKTPKLQI